MLERIAWYVMVGGTTILLAVAVGVMVWVVVSFVQILLEENPNG